MLARIYQPARNIMQSGMGKTQHWVLEFSPAVARRLDPLMGWSSSSDMNSQVRLSFDTVEAAVDYAQEHGIEVQLAKPQIRKPVLRQGGYGENFATNRRGSWTH